jgi:hypothetical protein
VASGAVNGKWAFGLVSRTCCREGFYECQDQGYWQMQDSGVFPRSSPPEGNVPAWEPGRGVQPSGNTFIEFDFGFASHLDKIAV